ncbi:uncharacterized protein LOC144126257 [Amblyomma americanum]
MRFAFSLLCFVSAAQGSVHQRRGEGDMEPASYQGRILPADLSSQGHADDRTTGYSHRRRRGRIDAGHGHVGRLPDNEGVAVTTRAPDGPRRRASDEERATPYATKDPKLVTRRLGRIVFCLVVACVALLALLLCLAILVLWLRSRYRTRGKALYNTLSVTDPDVPTPAASSKSHQWRLSDDSLSSEATVAATDRHSRAARQSLSEPIVWSMKTTDMRDGSPHRHSSESGLSSATPSEIGFQKATTPAYADVDPGGARKRRKSLRVKSTDAMLPQRSYSIRRTDVAERQPKRDRRNKRYDTKRTRRKRRSSVDHRPSEQGSVVSGPAIHPSVSFTDKANDLSEDYQQYSYSDDVRLDVRLGPLPTFIRQSVTKTVRRWRTHASDARSTLSAERRAEAGRPFRRPWSARSSFESLTISEPQEEGCHIKTDATPWTQLLALCKQSKSTDFLQIIQEGCEATRLHWDEGGGDVFRVLAGSAARERLVRVVQLRPQDVHWHAGRLRLARELRGLRNGVHNRTSAFSLDVRTSLVRDTYPRILWDALRHDQDIRSPKELEQPKHFLVTEMQPGWRPLTSFQLSDPSQAASVLQQACWALAVAEAALQFEHRLPGANAVLLRPTRSPRVEFMLHGRLERLASAGVKIRLQGLQMARMSIDRTPEYTDLRRFHEFVTGEEATAVFRKMARLLREPVELNPGEAGWKTNESGLFVTTEGVATSSTSESVVEEQPVPAAEIEDGGEQTRVSLPPESDSVATIEVVGTEEKASLALQSEGALGQSPEDGEESRRFTEKSEYCMPDCRSSDREEERSMSKREKAPAHLPLTRAPSVKNRNLFGVNPRAARRPVPMRKVMKILPVRKVKVQCKE